MTLTILGDPIYGTVVEISAGFSSTPSTGSNVGTGVGVFKQVVGSNLEFRSLISSDNSILRTQNTNDIDLRINSTAVTSIVTAAIAGITYTASRALVTNASGVIVTANTTSTEIGYVNGVTSSIQTQLDAKQAVITGAASTVTVSNLSSNLALISNGSGKISTSTVTSTELGYLSGTTSLIQNQINGKQATITGAATTVTTANLSPNRVLASDASGKIVVTTVPADTFGSASLLTSIIDIGDWNMDANVGRVLPHGIADFKKIRSVYVVIRSDDGSINSPLNGVTVSGTSALNGGIGFWEATNIYLQRVTGGDFDNTSYDSTSYNRGWITIQYLP